MNAQRTPWLVAGIAVLAAAASWFRPADAQPAAATPSTPGRYHLVATSQNNATEVLVIDTVTGQVWSRTGHYSPDGKPVWEDQGAPPFKHR